MINFIVSCEPVVWEESILKNKPPLLITLDIVSPLVQPAFSLRNILHLLLRLLLTLLMSSFSHVLSIYSDTLINICHCTAVSRLWLCSLIRVSIIHTTQHPTVSVYLLSLSDYHVFTWSWLISASLVWQSLLFVFLTVLCWWCVCCCYIGIVTVRRI